MAIFISFESQLLNQRNLHLKFKCIFGLADNKRRPLYRYTAVSTSPIVGLLSSRKTRRKPLSSSCRALDGTNNEFFQRKLVFEKVIQ